MIENSNTFIKRLVGFSLGPIISSLLGFIMIPIITYFIDPIEFGKASMYTTALSLSSLVIYLGTDQAFLREYNSVSNKLKLMWNCFLPSFLFSLMIGIFILIFNKNISLLLFNGDEKFIVYMLAISLPLSVIQRFNVLIIRAQEKARLYSTIQIIEKILNFIFLFTIILTIEVNFKGVVFSQFLSLLITAIIEMIINKEFWLSKIKIEKSILKSVFSYGLPLVPASIFAWLLSSMDKVALRTWSNFYELGIYSVALKITMILDLVKNSFTTFWSPTAYRWYKDKVDNDIFIRVSKIITSLMVVLFGIIVLLKDYIVLVAGKEYHKSAIMIPFLLLSPIMYTITETTHLGIKFSRKTGYKVLITGISAAFNLLGNYVLVPYYGGVGATISTGISYIIYFWLNTIISRRLWFKFDLSFYLVNTSLMLLMAILSIIIEKQMIVFLIFIVIVIYNKSNIIKILSY